MSMIAEQLKWVQYCLSHARIVVHNRLPNHQIACNVWLGLANDEMDKVIRETTQGKCQS